MPKSNIKITPVPGYEEYYGATEDGRVFSFDYRRTGKTVELAQSELTDKRRKSETKYKRAKMWHINKSTPTAIHRIIALTFIDNPYGYSHVNHIDGNKSNNNKDNLEWCSNAQNIIHAEKNGLSCHHKGQDHPLHVLSEKEVIDIKKELKLIAPFKGQLTQLGEKYGVSKHCIFDIKHGRSWGHL